MYVTTWWMLNYLLLLISRSILTRVFWWGKKFFIRVFLLQLLQSKEMEMATNRLKPGNRCPVHVFYVIIVTARTINLDIDSSNLLKRHLGACSWCRGLILPGRASSRLITRPTWRARSRNMLTRWGSHPRYGLHSSHNRSRVCFFHQEVYAVMC